MNDLVLPSPGWWWNVALGIDGRAGTDSVAFTWFFERYRKSALQLTPDASEDLGSHRMTSSLLGGVGIDAAFVADNIAGSSAARTII